MTYRISELLEKAAAHAVPVVRGIRDTQFPSPTPCSAYDVRELVNHLFEVVVHFQALAAKEQSPYGDIPDRLHGDWPKAFEEEVRKLVEAWARPGAEEGTTGSMDMPARTVASMVLLDLTVHAWDLAKATAQHFEPDAEVVDGLYAAVEAMAPMARRMDVFGDAVTLPEGASAFDRLLALTGRDPRVWAG